MTTNRYYYRIMLGAKSIFADQCFSEGWIGCGWLPDQDLTGRLPDDWRESNARFIPAYLEEFPDKTKVAAGSACGMMHTICKGVRQEDIVLCPDGAGNYRAATVASDYFYVSGEEMPHRRRVDWLPEPVARSDMSVPLQRSTGSSVTVCHITKYADEIESLLEGNAPPKLIATDELVEDPSVFALESHLEDFLIQNWAFSELGRSYDLFEEEEGIVGQQYPTDTGYIDILAISKDKRELLVVELKKGRASDAVVGQIQRYMGYVQDELAESGQSVRGCIIALEDDLRIQRALSVTTNIDFYQYQVSFNLFKVSK